MTHDNIIANFFISNKFEAINFKQGLNSFIDFEYLGISEDEYRTVGSLFFNVFNNFNSIIKILEESKKHLDEPLYETQNYIEKNLAIIDKFVAEIITKELDTYAMNEFKNIQETHSNLEHTQKELKEHIEILNNSSLYNNYYDNLINDTKKRINSLKNQEEIKNETDFLNDLYLEKNDTKKGKETIQSIIQDLENDEKKLLKDVRNLDEIPSLIDKYISNLINDIVNYKYYFDMYFGLLEENDLKNKDISYFQSIFGLDFEIPRHIIYASYENYGTYFPLKNLMYSIYEESKNKKEKLTNSVLYKKVLNMTSKLNDNKKIIYLKSYEINNLKDILSIYFNLFIQEKICLKKCANCGKYFIPSSRADEKYCNNPSPQNVNKTCKEYGAKKAYRDEIKSTPLKYEHNRTSQFYRMRINRAKSQKEKTKYESIFNAYKENYQKNKIKYKLGKLKESDFVEWIKNQKVTKK